MTDILEQEFEHWASLPPAYNIEKDGDGDYEDFATAKLFDCWCYAFKKGAFSGAAEMQKQCGIDYDKLAKLETGVENIDKLEPLISSHAIHAVETAIRLADKEYDENGLETICITRLRLQAIRAINALLATGEVIFSPHKK